MRAASLFYSTPVRNYQRKSVYKIYRKTGNGWKVEDIRKEDFRKATTNQNHNHNQSQHETQPEQCDEIPTDCPNYRQNEMKIQMLSKSLYDQIFRNNKKNVASVETIKK